MKWPWQRTAQSGDRLAIRHGEDSLAWVQADFQGRLLRCGVEPRGSDTAPDFARRIKALGLPATGVTALLELEEALLLQIEAPAVKPEELKSAARWRIKDQVDARLDELTIDVLSVGDGRARAMPRQLFVAAARNARIQGLSQRAQAAGLALSVIDIVELAQRNLFSLAARSEGLGDRATAALMRHGEQALLTICAGGELYYTRRLDWDEAGLAAPAAPVAPALPDLRGDLDFVDYGATEGPREQADAPRLVVEVQRSMDLWERSWPDLPVAALWVDAGEAGAALVGGLEPALGFPVHLLNPERLFPGLDTVAATPTLRTAVLPLLGALLRDTASA